MIFSAPAHAAPQNQAHAFDSKSQSVNLSATVGYGASVTGGFNQSKINSDYASVQEQSGILAGDGGFQIRVRGNTDLKGAVNLASLQDTAQFDSKSQNIGGSITVGFGGAAGSINYSQSNVHDDYASVQEQSGIVAGDGGFQIKVNGNTDLKGAVIASSQQAIQDGKNRLTTGTLTTSDLQNHAAASADSSGIDLNSGMLTQGKYGATKAAVGTLLNNASESGNSSGHTRSAVSTGEVTITDEARQLQLTGKNAEETVAGLNRDTANAQVATQRQDVQRMRETVEAERAIKAEAFKQITVIGDKVYRKETEEKKLINITCQENRTACSQAVVTLDQINAVNGKITDYNNGMLNDEQAALMNAYMQATGQQLQDGVIVVVNPMINDVVSEAAWAAWKKVEEVFGFGTSSVGDLNLALEAIALAQGAKLDTVSHSAGNFGVAEMLRRLDESGVKDAAIGTVTMIGSPVNAQGTADTVNTITSGQGTVQQSTHRDDLVGTMVGGNSATGGQPSGFLEAHTTYGPNVLDIERVDSVWGNGQGSVPVIVSPHNSTPE